MTSRLRPLALAATLLVPTAAALAHIDTVADLIRGPTAKYRPHGIRLHESNFDPDSPGFIERMYPYETEVGHWTAVGFTFLTSTYVDEVRFVAPHVSDRDIGCVTTNDRLVQLYVGDAGPPPAVPDVLASILVPGDPAPTFGGHEITVTVEPPVWVPEGETLFVAIEMNGVWPDQLSCLTLAGDDDAPENEYWSNAVDPRYDWAGLESVFRIAGEPMVSVSGMGVFYP